MGEYKETDIVDVQHKVSRSYQVHTMILQVSWFCSAGWWKHEVYPVTSSEMQLKSTRAPACISSDFGRGQGWHPEWFFSSSTLDCPCEPPLSSYWFQKVDLLKLIPQLLQISRFVKSIAPATSTVIHWGKSKTHSTFMLFRWRCVTQQCQDLQYNSKTPKVINNSSVT